MLLGRGRRLWMWLALCAAPAAVGLTVFPQAVHAETPEEEAARLAREAMSEAQRLKADFTAFEGNVAKLQGEIDSFPGTLLSQYKCPPEQPSKEAKYDELNQFRGRVNRLTVELNRLVDRRNQLGRAGEGQVYSGAKDLFKEGIPDWLRKLAGAEAEKVLITDADIKRVEDQLTRMRSDLQKLNNQLTAIPPQAKDCDTKNDPVRTITFNAPSKDPGQAVTAQITATTASGKPVVISGVTVTGILDIGTATGVGGIGTQNATYDFKIDDIKRQGPFNLNVTVTGVAAGAPAGAAPGSHRVNVNYSVNNVAPTIEKVPDDPTAKPGDPINLQGQVIVVDRNADGRNAQEVTRRMIALDGHPAGLETRPDQMFRAFSTIDQVSHDPATGRYVFDVKRLAALKLPHPHGKYETTISVMDRKGAKANNKITFIVENVAPTLSIRAIERHFHSGDGKTLTVIGTVYDDNGRDDIEEVEVDARPAGGGLYKLSTNTITKDPKPTDRGYAFTIKPDRFGHTNASGTWPITGKANDNGAPEQGQPNPVVATDNTDITVTNLAPDSNAFGYLSNLGLIPGKKNVCPGEIIRLGILVRDPEGDTLKVTAVIKETGATVELKIEPGNNTHTGNVAAPLKPGTYTIEYVIEEQGVNNPHTVRKQIKLTVVDCGDKYRPRTGGPGPGGGVHPGGAGSATTGGSGGAGNTTGGSGGAGAGGSGGGPSGGQGGPATEGGSREDLAVEGPPGSEVKIGPEAPALPGEMPDNMVDIAYYARLLQLAAILDDLNKQLGDTMYPGQPPLTLMVLGSYMNRMLWNRPFKLMEDGGNHPDGTCGAGDGEGPVFEIGDPPNTPPDDGGLDFFDRLFRDAIDTAKKAGEEPPATAPPANGDGYDWSFDLGYKWKPADDWSLKLEYDYDYGSLDDTGFDDKDLDFDLRWRFAPKFDLALEYRYWADQEFGSRVPGPDPAQQARDRAAADARARAEADRRAKAEQAAEKDRLQKQYDALTDRANRLNTAISNTDQAIRESDNEDEKKRLRGQLGEMETLSDRIHTQSVDVASRLNELSQEEMAADEKLRNEISVKINEYSAEAIAEIIGLDESLQDAKDFVTTGTKWISTGSKMQAETSRTTRIADRELAAALVKLDIVEVLMEFAAPGSAEMKILEEFKARYERQRDAAEEHLASNRNLTLIGYGIDVGLTLTGAKLVQWGKTFIAGAATRALTPAAAETVIANTTERGLIELGKSALGRSGASEAAASGTAQVVEKGASQLYDEAASAIGNASKTQVDDVMHAAQQAALNGSRTSVVTQGGSGGGGHVSSALSQLADDAARAGNEAEARALREAAELVKETAKQHGGDEWKAMQQLWDEVVGHDLLPKPPGTEAVGQAMDDAVALAREALASPAGQRAAENAAAQQVAQTRGISLSEARRVLQGVRDKAKDWVDDIDFGSGTFYSLPFVGFLLGMSAQEGYAQEAPQTTLDANGNGTIHYYAPTFAGFSVSPKYRNDNSWDVALRYAGEFGGFKVAGGVNYADDPQPGSIGSIRLDDKFNWNMALGYSVEFGKIKAALDYGYENQPFGNFYSDDALRAGFGTEYMGGGVRPPTIQEGIDVWINVPFEGVKLDGGGPAHGGFGQNGASPYLNDRWQLNDKWSFNIGLRYEDVGGEEDSCRIKKFVTPEPEAAP